MRVRVCACVCARACVCVCVCTFEILTEAVQLELLEELALDALDELQVVACDRHLTLLRLNRPSIGEGDLVLRRGRAQARKQHKEAYMQAAKITRFE